jgi:transposase
MTDQPLYAGFDVSLETTTVCLMARDGTIIQEAVVPSDPTALATCLAEHRDRLERIGLEAGPLSEWIVRGLADYGLTAVLMETRQVRAALSAQIVKTDRKDARGMAHLLRTGWFRPVHVKTMDAREQRAMPVSRTSRIASAVCCAASGCGSLELCVGAGKRACVIWWPDIPSSCRSWRRCWWPAVLSASS